MDVSQHPEFDRILEAMKTCQGSAWTGIAYRSASPRYASGPRPGKRRRQPTLRRPLEPQGGVPAVYVSLDLETAMAETIAHHRYYGIPVHRALPANFCRHRV